MELHSISVVLVLVVSVQATTYYNRQRAVFPMFDDADNVPQDTYIGKLEDLKHIIYCPQKLGLECSFVNHETLKHLSDHYSLARKASLVAFNVD